MMGDHLLVYGGMKDGYKISNELRIFQLGNCHYIVTLYEINLDQPHLDRKMNAFKDKLKKIFFTAILKDYMNSMKKKMQ